MEIGEKVCKLSNWFPVESFEIFEHFSGTGTIIGLSEDKYIVEWGLGDNFLSHETDFSIIKASEAR